MLKVTYRVILKNQKGGIPQEYPLFIWQVFMTVKDIIDWLDRIAPFKYAEKWDSVGLQVGDYDATVRAIMVCLEVTSYSLRKAVERDCNCMIVHHPVWIDGFRALTKNTYPGKLIFELIKKDINVIVCHTNLDASVNGPTACIAKALALRNVKSIGENSLFAKEELYGGLAVQGELEQSTTVSDLVSELSEKLLLKGSIQVVGDFEKEVKKVAICAGSCASLLKDILLEEVDCFITGELRYHDARLAEEEGLVVLSLGHFMSEKFVMDFIAGKLKEWIFSLGEPLEVFTIPEERDVFKTLGGGFEFDRTA